VCFPLTQPSPLGRGSLKDILINNPPSFAKASEGASQF
jgi:hypothetical protein